jgi:hypothetical protein
MGRVTCENLTFERPVSNRLFIKRRHRPGRLVFPSFLDVRIISVSCYVVMLTNSRQETRNWIEEKWQQPATFLAYFFYPKMKISRAPQPLKMKVARSFETSQINKPDTHHNIPEDVNFLIFSFFLPSNLHCRRTGRSSATCAQIDELRVPRVKGRLRQRSRIAKITYFSLIRCLLICVHPATVRCSNIICTVRNAKFSLSNQPYLHCNVHTMDTQSAIWFGTSWVPSWGTPWWRHKRSVETCNRLCIHCSAGKVGLINWIR